LVAHESANVDDAKGGQLILKLMSVTSISFERKEEVTLASKAAVKIDV
jgi:hypothetical protein